MSEQTIQPTFVMFYANWCGYCQIAMPEFDALIVNNKNNPINIIKINNDVNRELIDQHRIESFPTFRLYYNGIDDLNNYVDYNEHHESVHYRTMQGFTNFLERHILQ
jgi:thiol-disulfide isomerase/thioredoxin